MAQVSQICFLAKSSTNCLSDDFTREQFFSDCTHLMHVAALASPEHVDGEDASSSQPTTLSASSSNKRHWSTSERPESSHSPGHAVCKLPRLGSDQEGSLSFGSRCRPTIATAYPKIPCFAVTTSTSRANEPQPVSANPSDWSIDDVIRYMLGIDHNLGPHMEVFRKHVSPSFLS